MSQEKLTTSAARAAGQNDREISASARLRTIAQIMLKKHLIKAAKKAGSTLVCARPI